MLLWTLSLFLAVASANAQRAQPSAPLGRFAAGDQQTAGQSSQSTIQTRNNYEEWLDEDVRWIISDEERNAFKQLSKNQERNYFIEAFWQRRDPNPDTLENEYKDEHYRRIIFANEEFASFTPGWRTDRGRFYIMYGPPDEIESHASGGTYSPPLGGQSVPNLPYQVWRYRFIKGLGKDVILTFADVCRCGDYRLTEGASPHYVADERAVVPNNRQPQIRFKDLEELVIHKIDVRQVPFTVRTDFVKATDFTVMVPVTVRVVNRDITFANTSDVARGTLNIFGRVTTLAGWVVETFEDTVQVDVPHELLQTVMPKATFYQKVVLLRPGQYWLDIAVRDVNRDRVGTSRLRIHVAKYNEGKMATSSLILADKMGPLSQENAPGTGHFLVGTTYVRPLVSSMPGKPVTYSRNQNINVWMQVYDLAVDEKMNKSSAGIEYEVVNVPGGKVVMHIVESADRTGDQITVKTTLPARNLHRGAYRLRIKVRDELSRQVSERSTTFNIE